MSEIDVPWEKLYTMSHLTLLVYDIFKYWTLLNLKDLDKFFSQERDNDELCHRDKHALQLLRTNFPQGQVIKYYTNSADLQCVICKSITTKSFTIVFRGSESATDWLHSFMSWKWKLADSDSFVHFGYYKQLLSENFNVNLGNMVSQLIEECPDWEWTITGHSAGGSHSVLMGYMLGKQFPGINFNIVSLGAPRVGDASFEKAFNECSNLNHYRICYDRDIATAYPIFGYKHVGIPLLYTDDKWKINSDDSYTLLRCWNPWDHYGLKYINSLKNKCNDIEQ